MPISSHRLGDGFRDRLMGLPIARSPEVTFQLRRTAGPPRGGRSCSPAPRASVAAVTAGMNASQDKGKWIWWLRKWKMEFSIPLFMRISAERGCQSRCRCTSQIGGPLSAVRSRSAAPPLARRGKDLSGTRRRRRPTRLWSRFLGLGEVATPRNSLPSPRFLPPKAAVRTSSQVTAQGHPPLGRRVTPLSPLLGGCVSLE